MTTVDANDARYIVRSILRKGSNYAFGVYDSKTDQWLNQSFPEEYQAKVKADELNRLKDPH